MDGVITGILLGMLIAPYISALMIITIIIITIGDGIITTAAAVTTAIMAVAGLIIIPEATGMIFAISALHAARRIMAINRIQTKLILIIHPEVQMLLVTQDKQAARV